MSEINPEAVYLWRTNYRDLAEIDYATAAAEFLAALSPEVPLEGHIALKPNVTWGIDADTGIIVHPEFIGGLMDGLVQRGVGADRLVAVEGNMRFTEEGTPTWTAAGYTAMAERRGARLAHVDNDEVIHAPSPGAAIFDSLPLGATIAEAALLINVPIAKCHNLSLTTLSIKNMMGMVIEPSRHFCHYQEVDEPVRESLWDLNGRGYSVHEERFCHKLSDLASAVQALPGRKLHVVSGILGRDGTAFATGNNYLLNFIAASENPVHLDTVVTFLMGIDPLKTPYLTIAAERGLGSNRVEEVEVLDLRRERRLPLEELERSVHHPSFVPMVRTSLGYRSRFRADGALVPWGVDNVNQRRQAAGVAPVPVE